MKAVEILKAFSDRYESAYGFNNILVSSLGDINEALEELTSIEQRIAELEEELLERISESNMYCSKTIELGSPKTCDGCKYNHPETYLEHKYCACNNKCSLWNYADYYEPKEQK